MQRKETNRCKGIRTPTHIHLHIHTYIGMYKWKCCIIYNMLRIILHMVKLINDDNLNSYRQHTHTRVHTCNAYALCTPGRVTNLLLHIYIGILINKQIFNINICRAN